MDRPIPRHKTYWGVRQSTLIINTRLEVNKDLIIKLRRKFGIPKAGFPYPETKQMTEAIRSWKTSLKKGSSEKFIESIHELRERLKISRGYHIAVLKSVLVGINDSRLAINADNKSRLPFKKILPKLAAYKQVIMWRDRDGLSYKQINNRLPELGLKKHEDYQSVGTMITRYKRYFGIK